MFAALVMMLRLCLLAIAGLAMADTDPGRGGGDLGEFDICPDDKCLDGWMKVENKCVMFMSGWDEERAREECRENKADYMEYFISRDKSVFSSLSVCVVPRERQCECGRSNVIGSDLITGGKNARKNEFPWMARLEIIRRQNSQIETCGGSIITRDSILTAAHCTSGEVKMRNEK